MKVMIALLALALVACSRDPDPDAIAERLETRFAAKQTAVATDMFERQLDKIDLSEVSSCTAFVAEIRTLRSTARPRCAGKEGGVVLIGAGHHVELIVQGLRAGRLTCSDATSEIRTIKICG
jgi:hypothetical protein